MNRTLLPLMAACGLSSLCSTGLAEAPADISPELEKLIAGSNVPSLAAAAVIDGKLVAIGATGIRKKGDPTPVTLDDKYHLGSCTKSMTATLAAILVEQGKIRWDTTLGEVFDCADIHPDYRDVTLRQLVTNRAGCPKNINPLLWLGLWYARGTPPEQRMKLVEGILKKAPAAPPGTRTLYSNAGFSIAGGMLETVTGTPWEELLQTELFKPLEMTSAGFRAPASPGKTDQPWGHDPDPVPPEPKGDNPRAVAPAGAVHCSIADFAKYASLHLGLGDKTLLSPAALELLHTAAAPDSKYAMGWSVAPRKWARGKALTHAGSNTSFYSVIWLAPARNFAAVALCNTGEDEGFDKCDDAIELLIENHLEN